MKESNQEIAKNLFPERLRNLRTERGISQADMAGAINISRVSLSYYENGERTPDIGILSKIAKYFDVSYDYLLGESSCKNRENIDIERVTGLKEKTIETIKRFQNKIPYRESLNYFLQDAELLEHLCLYLFSGSYSALIARYGSNYGSMHNVDLYGKYSLARSIERIPQLMHAFDDFMKKDPKLYNEYLECLRQMSLKNTEPPKREEAAPDGQRDETK